MKAPNIDELNKIYDEAEAADKEIWAEQRSNLQLIAGEHYSKKSRHFNSQIRNDKTLSDSQKLRITKNHIHKIYRHYVNQILTFAPGVSVVPQMDSELSDQKSAELFSSVWEDAKDHHRLKEKVRNWCEYFIGVGAVATKIFWDPNAGEFKGYKPKAQIDDEGSQLIDEMGQPMFEMDESGQPLPDEDQPVFSGDFIFEDIFDFNFLIHAGAINRMDAECEIIRKLVDTKTLEKKYAADEEKLGFVKNATGEIFIVFDSTKQSYERSKGQTLIREHYWKPSYLFPNGYFTISTSAGILEEGELPGGIYPLVWAGCDLQPTSRRARSVLKVARPFQAEINRASSQMATHQVTVGDDKIIYQAGSKLSPGALLAGVRGIMYNGAAPQIMPGRDGSQFLPYIQAQIAEMYDAVMMEEENEEKNSGQFDPYALLMRNLKQQKKYAIYGEKFNQFLVDVATVYLELGKIHLPDERVIAAIGMREAQNLPEFRKKGKLCYQIKVEEQDETVETKFGKQLTANNILQYVGGQLKPDDIGKIIRNMPFGNTQEEFEDFTLDYDNVKNDMLALERGEYPEPNIYENHPYIINKLSSRMKQSDFKLLPQQVQGAYRQKIQAHMQLQDQVQQKIMAAKSEYLPTGGAMVACDLFVPNPKNPTSPAKRVRLPYQALEWLVNKLETQGQSLDKLENMNQGALAELASQHQQSGAMVQQQPQMGGLPQPPMMNGHSPIGVS